MLRPFQLNGCESEEVKRRTFGTVTPACESTVISSLLAPLVEQINRVDSGAFNTGRATTTSHGLFSRVRRGAEPRSA